ncbi:MAG: hypothetical protein WCV93_03830 [Candidatus Shapirobacteria bacterium]|jgi:hypothetical protein
MDDFESNHGSQQGQQRFVSGTANGEGVPRICDPKYSFDKDNHWVFEIPDDVNHYLKSQFGEGVEIQVKGNEPQQTSRGYCGYDVYKDGEFIGGIQLGGRDHHGPDGRTGVVSEWKLFRRQENQ